MIYLKGNLLNAETDVIAHQTNCLGAMGAGLALQIKKRWPVVYEQYHEKCLKSFPDELLGTCFLTGNIAHLFGQLNYDRNSRMTNYEALYTALNMLRVQMKDKDWKSVAFPKNIGSGLAGGHWPIVEAMIEYLFEDYTVEIWEYDAR
jgi:O-acetyl-ADP-ribose deacetylase (regulator of RNase III)